MSAHDLAIVSSAMSELGPLADRLDAIAEEIDEMAFDGLREAVAAGRGERPAADKQLMQARRAIEKAAALLRRLDDHPT